MTPAGEPGGTLRSLFESPGDRAAETGVPSLEQLGPSGSAGLPSLPDLPNLPNLVGAFGLYLAGRSDLLPAGACQELSTLADRAPAVPPTALSEHLRRQLGAPPDRLFQAFEAEPERSRLLFQDHRARTVEGDHPVDVILVRPGLEAVSASERERLRKVATEVLREAAVPVEPVVEDFLRSFQATLDLASRADRLRVLEQEARGDGDLRFPRVDRRLSSAGALTVEQLEGRRLSDLLEEPLDDQTEGQTDDQTDDQKKGEADPPRAAHAALARRLHRAWLRLALGGRSVPAEVHAADVIVLGDGRVAFLGGPLVQLGREVRGVLWSYLETASARDPAEASDELLRLMEPVDGGREDRRRRELLRHRLRHVVLFRDGRWRGAGEGLAEHLFVQWRLAREAGYRPTPEALLFIRGLTSVAMLGRRLTPSPAPSPAPGPAPREDPLRAALGRLRLLRGADRLRRALVPGDVARTVASYATALSELPGAVDRGLDLVESGGFRVRVDEGREPEEGAPRGGAVVALAVFVALATIALVAFRLGGADALGPGPEKLAAGLLAAFGGALLWAVSRSR